MNLQQLVTFSTVISEGSMTAAAEKLYLTQPAVSQQIRNLEDEMGVNLLLRGTRQARPTVHGQLLYEYAKKIISLTQQAQVAIQSMNKGLEGSLRVGTLNSLGMYMISPMVGSFLKFNPKISIKLVYDDVETVLKALSAGELDVAILPDVKQEFGIEIGADCEARRLLKDEVWLVASSKEANLPQSISLRDLVSRPIVRFTERYSGFDSQLRQAAERQNVKLKPAFESNNVGTVKKVIESGLGWGFLPAHSVRKQVRASRLTVIEVEGLAHEVPLLYYVRGAHSNTDVIETFFRALQQPTISIKD